MYKNLGRTLALACAITPLFALGMDSNNNTTPTSTSTASIQSDSGGSSFSNFLSSFKGKAVTHVTSNSYAYGGGTSLALVAGASYVMYKNWGNNWTTVKEYTKSTYDYTAAFFNKLAVMLYIKK